VTFTEIKALREKHRPRWDEGTPRGEYECLECDKPYPCDAIRLLDATENLKPNDLKTKVECIHIIGLMTLPEGWDVIEHGQTSFAFTYCPKCGEKL